MQKNAEKKIRVAGLSDIHCKETSSNFFKELFIDISEHADILLLCGDLCDHGYAIEAEVLAGELTALRIPVVGVLGNHDYTNGEEQEIKKILSQANMTLLEDNPVVIDGVGFAGVKGFGGGFDNHMLASFGENAMKAFVQETINEVLSLETSLAHLDTEEVQKKVVAMHYSPIKSTLVGEPEEIFPFLGSSRLSEPINRFNASVVFHGHAHHGTHTGKTHKDIPVYNVAYPLMQKISEKKPYKVVEL